jgi:NADPH:quinone reductase
VKAVRIRPGATGPRWEWTDDDAPAPADGEVLVSVTAAALNHADLLMRDGRYTPSDASWKVAADRVGFELAGTVVATGPTSGQIPLGTTVMAQAGGACAELVAVDAGLLLPCRGLAARCAAALPSGLLTEFDALAQAGFRPGDDVLITGAASGVGRIGVQLARVLGAGSVVATTRSSDSAAGLRRLGADRVIVTGRDPLAAASSCRVVLDHVGGGLLAEVVDAAPAGARIVQIGRLGGGTTTVDLERLAARRLTLIGTTFRDRGLDELRALTARLRDEPRLRDRWGGIEPTIDSTFALTDPEPAAGRLADARHSGKVVLLTPSRPGPEPAAR